MNSVLPNESETLRVGILGTGKIGTDLLIKVLRSPHLKCVIFAGRNLESPGMQRAQELGVPVSDRGILAFSESRQICDLVFDATAAHFHNEHAQVFLKKRIKAIDLTPAKVGPLCVPAINEDLVLNEANVNMVTCGGQTTVPIAAAVNQSCFSVRGLRVHTLVSHDSIGQATLDNIDDYYATTSHALQHFASAGDISVDLEVAPQEQQPIMTTRMEFDLGMHNPGMVAQAVRECEQKMQSYVPGYTLVGEPDFSEGGMSLTVQVRGMGDWIPEHAGNLDIINCAALNLAEKYARERRRAESRSLGGVLASLANFGFRPRTA